MTGKTTVVSNAAALLKAAKSAKGGDTILLAPGNYGEVSLSGLKASGGVVTIKSADPNNDAVFENLKLTRVSNFTIADVDVHHVLKPGESESSTAANINMSDNITFVGVDFTGSLNGNRNDDGNGLGIGSSNRIAILDCTFQEFNNATAIGRTDNVVFAGNTIREVREGVNMAELDHALFERNFISDVRGDLSKGDHPDAFQLHAGGTRLPSNDVTFRSNVIMSGGESQGIFIKSEKGLAGLHTNITVENNYVEGNYRNGIAVAFADGVSITGNTVRDGGSGTVPGLLVGNIINAVVADNIAPILATRADSVINSNVVWSNNIDLWDATTKKGVDVASVFSAPVASSELDFSALGAKLPGVGFHAVSQIGNLMGDTSAIIANYMPMLDGNFASHF